MSIYEQAKQIQADNIANEGESVSLESIVHWLQQLRDANKNGCIINS